MHTLIIVKLTIDLFLECIFEEGVVVRWIMNIIEILCDGILWEYFEVCGRGRGRELCCLMCRLVILIVLVVFG